MFNVQCFEYFLFKCESRFIHTPFRFGWIGPPGLPAVTGSAQNFMDRISRYSQGGWRGVAPGFCLHLWMMRSRCPMFSNPLFFPILIQMWLKSNSIPLQTVGAQKCYFPGSWPKKKHLLFTQRSQQCYRGLSVNSQLDGPGPESSPWWPGRHSAG